ncbi:MAG: thioredoxin domain-containing protein, partial [Candidatus Eisenbacteria bacterium]
MSPKPGAGAAKPGGGEGSAPGRKPNRLLGEKSPYLQQHAYNPVDWRPWGPDAFADAKKRGVPIFLSIGYSTCHWCHVMERESFEDDRVAALLNKFFVPVKVDREERPDVDRIYMNAMSAIGQGGGWPLNVFLAPDLAPFYGGTYFPPDTTGGRPGLMQILPHVHKAWSEQRADLEENGRRIFEALELVAKTDATVQAAPFTTLFDEALHGLERTFDAKHGGFGGRPKFPTIVNLNFLQRDAHRAAAAGDATRAQSARAMAFAQLDAMRAGGIHDHVGGGFHRYTVDEQWLVPHFEKMLYDQAQIALAFVEAFRIARRPGDADAARGVFAYVARDLTGPQGGFFSAEDADSEGEEGRFYVWTPAQLEADLGADDAALFARRYGVTAAGNFEDTGAS